MEDNHYFSTINFSENNPNLVWFEDFGQNRYLEITDEYKFVSHETDLVLKEGKIYIADNGLPCWYNRSNIMTNRPMIGLGYREGTYKIRKGRSNTRIFYPTAQVGFSPADTSNTSFIKKNNPSIMLELFGEIL